MIIAQRCVSLALMIAVVVASDSLVAQSLPSKPSYNPNAPVPGGFANQLNHIYADSVGTNYSVGAIVQSNYQQTFSNVPTTANNVGPSGGFSGSSSIGSSSQKPFALTSSSPTVSPYLRMFDDALDDGTSPTYQTSVRPLLQQQNFNRQFQLQQQQLERRVQQISAQPAFQPRGSESQMPTGHQTVMFNTGRYYPLNFRRR
jgi:hypothetical protein